MSTSYSQRLGRPIGVSHDGFGGAGQNLGIEALAGETEMVTVFDDFNGVVPAEGFGDAANWETMGWVGTDIGAGGPTADLIRMNAAATVTDRFNSCIQIFMGTDDDEGGSLQLDRVNASLPTSVGGGDFPHIWIAETGAGAAVNDNTLFVFATRIGLRPGALSTNWDSKLFIGWAEAGDVDILVPGTGLIAVAGGTEGPLVGFHVNEDGAIDGIAQRTFGTAFVEGTNFTRLIAAGGVDPTTANGGSGVATANEIMWFDLALRMFIADQSDAANNGAIEFCVRRVPKVTRLPGLGESNRRGEFNVWRRHRTILSNQCPNNDVALVPTIEAINGPTAGQDGEVYIDWWAFGESRFSRR